MSKRIGIWGDSIVWGAFDPEYGGWVARLKFDEEVSIYNLGISGDNTDYLLERFKVECKAREPDAVIFAIGINDSQYVESKNNPRVDVGQFKNNLESLVKQAKMFTKEIAFIGLTSVDESKTMPIPWDTTKYYDNENISQYDAIIKSVCEEKGLKYIELTDVLKNEDLYDGLHPNSTGHKKIFEKVKRELFDKEKNGLIS